MNDIDEILPGSSPFSSTAPRFDQRFDLGVTVLTSGAARVLSALSASQESAQTLLRRHASGDWGDVDAEDEQSNEEALHLGQRLLSSYPLATGEKIWVIWVITEADRSATTLLLPEEY